MCKLEFSTDDSYYFKKRHCVSSLLTLTQCTRQWKWPLPGYEKKYKHDFNNIVFNNKDNHSSYRFYGTFFWQLKIKALKVVVFFMSFRMSTLLFNCPYIYEKSNNAACMRGTACMQMSSNLVSARPLKIDIIRNKCLVVLYTFLCTWESEI